MSKLFSPYEQRSVKMRNRIAVSPMCQYSASGDGKATDWHLAHLGSFALGGAGLVMVEATAVEARGRISPQDLGLWSDDQVEPLARVVRFLRSQGAVSAIQLAHAGRKACTYRPWSGRGYVPLAEGGWATVAPSAVAFASLPEPQALDAAGIREIKAAFAAAAARSVAAGFEVIELHSAHGYLLHQFLSPISNRRDDEYGGSFENRVRLLREIARETRQAIPDSMPLWVRISATDWVEGGWDLEQSVELAKGLKEDGVDLMDCSSGGSTPDAKIPVGPGFQVPLAEEIRRRSGIATGAVGMIREPQQAESIVADGKADLVLLAKPFLENPRWPQAAAKDLGVKGSWPQPYWAVAG
jgi:2,4-dienoyl-CoA reductase-like NADH-dependent reductase (Old Yellow Enzyme family)